MCGYVIVCMRVYAYARLIGRQEKATDKSANKLGNK